MPDPAPANEAVAAWIDGLDDAQRGPVMEIRALILGADPAITEDIKWRNTLVFADRKNLIQTVVGKQHTTFIFFDGALLEDPAGLLEGDGKTNRSVRIAGPDFDRAALKALDLEPQRARENG